MREPPESHSKPHILLLATQRWPTGARLGLALQAAGFRVSIWCPSGHPLLLTQRFYQHHVYGAFEPLASLEAAVTAANAQMIVPCDDIATFRLQQLAERARRTTRLHRVLALIERSMGPADGLNSLTARSHVLNVAAEAGVAVPANAPLASSNDLDGWLKAHGFPAYLKADGTSGGIGVRPVHSYEEAKSAFRALNAPPRALRALKRLAIDRDPTLLGPVVRRQRPSISIQQAISGTDANSAIFCWQGDVLASVCVQVLATRYDHGPSTVVQLIQNTAMDRAAQSLASRLQLTGFYGLDFILDEPSGAPWLIEMNSRATQIAHFALGAGHDLAAAAFAAVTDTPLRARPTMTTAEVIALFPQEWQRDPASPMMQNAYHDVPWESPALVRSFVNQQPGWRHRLTGQYWRARRQRQEVLETIRANSL